MGREMEGGGGGKVEEEWECVDYLKHVRQSYESTRLCNDTPPAPCAHKYTDGTLSYPVVWCTSCGHAC